MIKCQLKTILKTLNLTQKDLCELINARPSTICSLCNNTFDYLNIHLLVCFSAAGSLAVMVFSSSFICQPSSQNLQFRPSLCCPASRKTYPSE